MPRRNTVDSRRHLPVTEAGQIQLEQWLESTFRYLIEQHMLNLTVSISANDIPDTPENQDLIDPDW